jgi:hypothetical protein
VLFDISVLLYKSYKVLGFRSCVAQGSVLLGYDWVIFFWHSGLILKIRPQGHLEMSVIDYQVTRRHIPEERSGQPHRCHPPNQQ